MMEKTHIHTYPLIHSLTHSPNNYFTCFFLSYLMFYDGFQENGNNVRWSAIWATSFNTQTLTIFVLECERASFIHALIWECSCDERKRHAMHEAWCVNRKNSNERIKNSMLELMIFVDRLCSQNRITWQHETNNNIEQMWNTVTL